MMNCCRGLLLGIVAAVIALAGGQAQEIKGPGKDVVDLAREAEEGKDVSKKAAELRKKFGNIRTLMRLYNPRTSGGLGIGPKGDGIEGKFSDLGDDGITAAALKKEAAEVVRMASINLVVMEIVHGLAPEKPFLGRGKKEWDRDAEAVKAGSRNLLEAVKAGDPKAVKAAATRINTACVSCHEGKK